MNHDKFARSLNAGIDALGKVIKLERQAYGLDKERGCEPGRSIEELMAELAEAELRDEQGYVGAGTPKH